MNILKKHINVVIMTKALSNKTYEKLNFLLQTGLKSYLQEGAMFKINIVPNKIV